MVSVVYKITPFKRWIGHADWLRFRSLQTTYCWQETITQPLEIPGCFMFPVPFPTKWYGEVYSQAVRITFSEYIWSRLMKSNSRFCKSPEFIFIVNNKNASTIYWNLQCI